MKSATITIPEELDEALAAYGRDRGLGSDADLESVVSSALRDLLTLHGYLEPFRPFFITPIHRDDDGPTDVSINHDHYFAEWSKSGGDWQRTRVSRDAADAEAISSRHAEIREPVRLGGVDGWDKGCRDSRSSTESSSRCSIATIIRLIFTPPTERAAPRSASIRSGACAERFPHASWHRSTSGFRSTRTS